MNLTFSRKRITGILTILPKNEIIFDDEINNYNFSPIKTLKLKSIMGFNKRRVVTEGTCVSDLCIKGISYLIEKGVLQKHEVDALILITQSPDYLMPPTSNIIQGKLGLKQDMICLDINQGCAGYIIGLFQSFFLLEQPNINKVLLLNADVISRKVSKRDRNSNPLIGDGASITIVEKDVNNTSIFGNIKMDGTGADALMIPAGGFRMPSSQETAQMAMDLNGNFRSNDNLVMKGDEVFNFVQTSVPPMIEELLTVSSVPKESVDYFMFHQPNKFMLQKLADKMGVPQSKMPNTIVENFGNSSGVSIPTAISFSIGDELLKNEYLICMAGFGVGLTWASLLIRMGHLSFCEMLEY